MKFVAALLLVVISVAVTKCGKIESTSKRVDVEQILQKPAVFVNKNLLIQGIVNQVNTEKQLFSVISQKEFQECGIGVCNINEQLPIRYSGELPEVGKLVEIMGRLRKIEKGFVYEAESVRKIESL